MNEASLSTDNFSKPKIFKDRDAIYALLVRLLLLEPGSIPGEPEMGIGLINNYRFSGEEEIDDLQENISKQVSKYLTDYQTIDVKAYLEDSLLKIDITIDNMLYSFTNESGEGLQLSSLT